MKSNKSISWNCIFGSFKLFPSSRIDFWPFLKLQKMEFGQRKISWNLFIWFHEFFWLGFFKFSCPLCPYHLALHIKSRSIWGIFQAVATCYTGIYWDFFSHLYTRGVSVWDPIKINGNAVSIQLNSQTQKHLTTLICEQYFLTVWYKFSQKYNAIGPSITKPDVPTLEILFIFSIFLIYFTSSPKNMLKNHPIIEHILIFL